jgi:hypothetical protein
MYATEYYTINRCLIIDIHKKVTSEFSLNLREISDFAFNENVEKIRKIWQISIWQKRQISQNQIFAELDLLYSELYMKNVILEIGHRYQTIENITADLKNANFP